MKIPINWHTFGTNFGFGSKDSHQKNQFKTMQDVRKFSLTSKESVVSVTQITTTI